MTAEKKGIVQTDATIEQSNAAEESNLWSSSFDQSAELLEVLNVSDDVIAEIAQLDISTPKSEESEKRLKERLKQFDVDPNGTARALRSAF